MWMDSGGPVASGQADDDAQQAALRMQKLQAVLASLASDAGTSLITS